MGNGVLAIIGVGLIGGSVGMAARRRGLFAKVRGTARHRESLDAALAVGAVDVATFDHVEAARGADMVVVATSVSSIPRFCLECAAVAAEGAVITDVGSVKGAIDAAVRPHMPEGRHFIGSHPLAGSEKRGAANAADDLLEGATCIITPAEETDADAARRLSEFWQALGMTVFRMSPQQHDSILANVSHLPHLAAAALVEAIPDRALPFGASGLRDTTRVASGDATLWRDIVEANSEEILAAMKGLEVELDALKGYILRGDYDGLEKYLSDAAGKRSRRFDGAKQGDKP